MKNTLRLLLALLAAAAFFYTSAQTPDPLLHHIPSDADQVYQIRLGTLGPKVDWMTAASLLKDRKTKPLPFDIPTLLRSGLDFHQDVVAARSNLHHPDSIQYTTVLVHLTDSAKFVAALHSQGHNFHVLHLPGRERAATDSNAACAWNDKLAVLVLAKVPKGSSLTAPAPHDLAGKAAAALHGAANSYFTTDPRFIAAFSDDADVHIWNRYSSGATSIMKMIQGNRAAAQLGQLAGKASHDPTFATIRFEPGKISFHSLKVVTEKELANLQRFNGHGLSDDLLSAIAPGKLIGMATLHYDLAAYIDSLRKIAGIDSLTAKLQEKGLGLEDLVHALKGDLMFLAYTPDSAGQGKGPVFHAVATLDDKDAFRRIAAALKMKEAAAVTADTGHHNMFSYYALHNDLAVFGADPLFLPSFFDHPVQSPSPAGRLLTDRWRNSILSVGIDMHVLADLLTPMLTKGDTIAAKNRQLLDAIRQLDILSFSSGGIHDNAMVTDAEITMTDKDRNGLSTLIDVVARLSAKKPAAAQ